jgi:hypothetical protein
MTDQIDPQDVHFVEGAKKLLSLDDDQVDELISKLSIGQLNALASAVTNLDKRAALAIYYTVRNKTVAESVDHLNVGDIVYVGDKKIKARVKIPSGPGNTIGVTIGKRSKLRMFNKGKISLEENVLGMTALPGISRMQELAGIFQDATETPEKPQVTSIEIGGQDDLDDHTTCAMNALEALEEALPNVCLRDAKLIRGRLQEILQMMNESTAPKQRKLKD